MPSPPTLETLANQTAEAAAALTGLEAPARAAALSIETAFEAAGLSLARSLGRAAADGRISMAELAQAVISAANAASRVGAEPGRGGGAILNLNLQGTSTDSLVRSEGQIAQALARAVRMGLG